MINGGSLRAMTNRKEPNEMQLDVYVRARTTMPVAMETVVRARLPSGLWWFIIRDEALIGSEMGLSDEYPDIWPYHSGLKSVSGHLTLFFSIIDTGWLSFFSWLKAPGAQWGQECAAVEVPFSSIRKESILGPVYSKTNKPQVNKTQFRVQTQTVLSWQKRF